MACGPGAVSHCIEIFPGRRGQVRELGQVGAVEGHQLEAPVQVPEEIGEVAEPHQSFGRGRQGRQIQVGQQLQGAIAAPDREDGLDLRVQPDLLKAPGHEPVRGHPIGAGLKDLRTAAHPKTPVPENIHPGLPGGPADVAGRGRHRHHLPGQNRRRPMKFLVGHSPNPIPLSS